MPRIHSVSAMPVSRDALYAWHARPGAFGRLAPPWQDMHGLEQQGGIENGARTRFVVRKGPLNLEWVALHENHIAGQCFTDVQERGPFASWRHDHRFVSLGEGTSRLEDTVQYELPGGALGRWVAGRAIEADLARLFTFRHERTRTDLQRHARFAEAGHLRILVTGASGLVGRALVPFLTTGGHEVVRLVRRRPGPGELAWDPERGQLDPEALEGFDAVVHLAGEGIADGRWSASRKASILASREQGTDLLARTLAGLKRPPSVLVAASAIGYYGARDDESVDEESPAGEGFLAEVCRRWEQATLPAKAAGIRVVNLRTGIVLTPTGGALARMLPPFQVGLGGPVGSGKQGMSWIGLDDLVGAIQFSLFTPSLAGPVNATAPAPESSLAFARTLGKVLGRPAVLPLPSAAVIALFGEMGQALLLDGARVLPTRLLDAGFEFECPLLEGALRREMGLFDTPTASPVAPLVRGTPSAR
jgi:uncharacterized protein (TIGR01777 family)